MELVTKEATGNQTDRWRCLAAHDGEESEEPLSTLRELLLLPQQAQQMESPRRIKKEMNVVANEDALLPSRVFSVLRE